MRTKANLNQENQVKKELEQKQRFISTLVFFKRLKKEHGIK